MKERQDLKSRLVRLTEQPFRVYYEELFGSLDADSVIMAPMPEFDKFLEEKAKIQASKHETDVELRVFYEEPLLNKPQEQHLFRRLNFLNYKAVLLLHNFNSPKSSFIDFETMTKEQLITLFKSFIRSITDGGEKLKKTADKLNEIFDQSLAVKSQLAACNVRLVMNVAKKQQEYNKNPSIDLLAEIVSDGYVGLMRAVDYFDYRRGNKFSTYATWAILDNMNRSGKKRQKYSALYSVGIDENDLIELPDESVDIHQETPVLDLLRKVNVMQRRVLTEYFGLEGKSSTLQKIGDEIGVTKERARQLKNKGLAKLKKLLAG